ncbi:late embryogenesis abundant (LEA) protein-like protein [Actinidia rufa]|uniref:Late embryogenesis abundant (LEA) protein-like protein n=1 Tax=Actinidia rufa TaxID=165716 RepID=A0A7J0G227_9ERIC|nr:late embryogenesis abundant (LEA) protein-like protein [Actinidia rufa]
MTLEQRDWTPSSLFLGFRSQSPDQCSFSVDATKATTGDDEENDLRVERTSSKNSVLVTLPEVVELSLIVVPVTKEDDIVHNYQIPSDDCFAHLEVQFRFYGLSSKDEGVLGQTYQPDFKNPAKLGVAMPVVDITLYRLWFLYVFPSWGSLQG